MHFSGDVHSSRGRHLIHTRRVAGAWVRGCRQGQNHGTAARWCGENIDVRTNALCTLGHDAQSDVGLVMLAFIRIKTNAIIAHLKTPGGLLLHIQPSL
jgi:hypothetical protein